MKSVYYEDWMEGRTDLFDFESELSSEEKKDLFEVAEYLECGLPYVGDHYSVWLYSLELAAVLVSLLSDGKTRFYPTREAKEKFPIKDRRSIFNRAKSFVKEGGFYKGSGYRCVEW